MLIKAMSQAQYDDLTNWPVADAARYGRGKARELLDLWRGGDLHGHELTYALMVVWREAVFPTSMLPLDTWREMFTAAGFIRDGFAVDPPAEPVTVYRGVVNDRVARRLVRKHSRGQITAPEFGWCWTGSVETARTLAMKPVQGETGGCLPWAVYRATVPPGALLMHLTALPEYVVDTSAAGVAIELVETGDGGTRR
jgi:hypothetical protein